MSGTTDILEQQGTEYGYIVTHREDGTVSGWRAAVSSYSCNINETFQTEYPPDPTPSREEIIAATELTVNTLYEQATRVINPLQDAVDIGEATEEEVARLKLWKTYRAKIGRVDTELAPDIAFPDIPD